MEFIKRLTVRSMLRLLVFVPVFFLVASLFVVGVEKYAVLTRSTAVKELAAMAALATEIAHEAQKERGMTAGFLGSNGQKFGDRLPGQRSETDKRISDFKDFLDRSAAGRQSAELEEKLRSALAGADRIAGIRQQVNAFAIPAPEAIAYYTATIHEFLTVIPLIARVSPDQEIMKSLTAYYNFVEAKERTGVERAVLSNTFAADAFAPGMYRRFIELLAAQQVFLGNFQAYAEPGARDFFQEKMRAPSVAQVTALEEIALDRHLEGGFGVVAELWFDTITSKIDLMKEVETRLAGDIVGLAEERMAEARSSLLFTSAAALAVVLLLLFLARFFASILVGSLEEISDSLSAGSGQVAAAAGEVASASLSLANGAGNQAAAIEETSASLEEISSMTRQNADNVGQADILMGEARRVIDTANESMRHLTGSMSEISKASEEISKIIKTIDEIAFQTNLLALNAAVEAARAGEAGAGFAVVADEVRNLAMRASEAARNTAVLIEETVNKVQSGAGLVQSTENSFRQVTESVVKISSLMAEIAGASREQATGVGQVNLGVTEMDTVTQQNAATAEEAASAAEELNAQAEQMKEMVARLTALVKGG